MALVAIGCCAGLSAQTLIKVGAGQGAKQTTIQLAYDSIVPKDISSAGAYIIELQSDYDPTIEVYPITFKAKTGASATNSITIKPATGVKKVIANPSVTKTYTGLSFASGATSLVLPDVTDVKVGQTVYGVGVPPFIGTAAPYFNDTIQTIDPVSNTITILGATTSAQTSTTLFVGKTLTQTILFNGAKYVTIDGVSRTDANTGLTIENPNMINCQTVMFTASAQYNTIKNCFIKGANQTGQINNGTSGQIYFNQGDNDFNTIDSNDICDIDGLPTPICMITFCAASGSSNNDITISNNNIYNIGTATSTNGNAGFLQYPSGNGTNTYNIYVLNNRFYWTKAISMNTSMSCIGFGGSFNGLGNRLEGNVMGYGAADGTGTANISALSNQTALALNMIINARNCTVKNNIIGGINLTAKTFLGISTNTFSATSFVADDYFSGNQVKDITISATATGSVATGLSINVASAFAANVKNNVVNNISVAAAAANTCSVYGINVAGTPVGTSAFSYINNKVSNLTGGDGASTAANIAYGIVFNGGAVALDRNLVYNLYAINTGTNATIRGIYSTGSNPTATLITNNIVRVGTYVSNDAVIAAFYQGAATTAADPCKIYNNTFYVGGQSPAAAIKATYGFYHTGISQALDIQNNIIANMRKLGNTDLASAEAHLAIQVPTATNLLKCNYNVYQFSKYFGNVESVNAPDMITWSSNNGSDANSLVADPKLVSSESYVPDMRIQTTSPAKAAGTNLLALVPKDYNGFTRTVDDIGAMAFGTVSEVATVREAELNLYSVNNAIVFNNFAGKTAFIYSVSGQLVKSALLTSDNENVSVNKGFYIVRVGSQAGKVLVK